MSAARRARGGLPGRPVRLVKRQAAVLLLVAASCGDLSSACSHETHLAPLDQQLVLGAKRADSFIVTREDGGMPRADRLLASSACENLAKVLADSKLDAGAPCP